MQPQDKLFQACSNGYKSFILEVRRESKRKTGNARSDYRHSKLRFIWHNYTPIILRRNTMTPEAERFNGWAAMLGFVAAIGAYATTGNVIPGIF